MKHKRRQQRQPSKLRAKPKKRVFTPRIGVVYSLVFLSFTTLILRLGYLQIAQGSTFRKEATTTSLTKIPVMPARGWIYDRSGDLLAYDQPIYSVYLTRMKNQNDQFMANELAPWFNTTPAHVMQLMQAQQGYSTITLFKDITPKQLALIEENHGSLPGINVVVDSQRAYPNGDLAGQVLGYVGPITPQNQNQYPNYLPLQSVGETGLEAEYESLLQGKVGYQVMEGNQGATSVGYSPAPTSGDTLQLTLDGRLQADAQEQMMNLIKTSAFGSQIKQGAAVVLNVHTGGVLAMLSYPYLDPNWYTNGSFVKHAQYLQTSGAQMNYAIQGPLYPGSTVKLANLLTALKYGAITPSTTIFDTNWTQIGTGFFHGDGAAGLTGVLKAVAISDETFFYHLGLNLGKWVGSTATTGGSPPAGMSYTHWLNTDFATGITRLFQGEESFGLGQLTGIDLPGEQKGIFYIEDSLKQYIQVPINPQTAAQSLQKTGRYVNHGTPVDLAFAATGQSQEFTPIELAQYVATIANGGKRLQPHLLKAVFPPEAQLGTNAKVKPIKVFQPVVQKNLNINPTYLHLAQQGMWGVCNLPYGTAAGSFMNAPYQAAGKTGTAQIYMNGQAQYNSVFIGYAPYNNPQIAVAVMIPGAGYGAQTAVPLARKLMDDYFKQHHEFFPKSQWQSPNIPKAWVKSLAYVVPEQSP